MRRGLALLLAAAVLAGCVAETVERRRPRRGPVKEVGYVDNGGGQVRYSTVGWSWIVASRRRLALKLMSSNCGPDLRPRVVDEYSRQDADAPYSGTDVGSSLTAGDQHYVIEPYAHIVYECVAPGAAPAPAVAVSTAPALVVPSVSASTAAAPSPTPAATPSPEPPK